MPEKLGCGIGRLSAQRGGGLSLREVRIAHTSIPGMASKTSAANTTFVIKERVMGSFWWVAWIPLVLPTGRRLSHESPLRAHDSYAGLTFASG